MLFQEVDPLPERCQNCVEQNCDECDYENERWRMPEEVILFLSIKVNLESIQKSTKIINSNIERLYALKREKAQEQAEQGQAEQKRADREQADQERADRAQET